VSGTYQPGLVCLSIAVAVASSFVTLDLAARIGNVHGFERRLWLVAGSLMMGLGIWSMHFVGMLAYEMHGMDMRYDLGTTIASIVPAIAGSGVALWLVSRPALTWPRWIYGGGFLGLAIVSMHYVGMEAMRMPAVIRYDPAWFAASIAIAVAASLAALWIAFHYRSEARLLDARRGVAALVLGGAIAGMHYAGMAVAPR
jgi:NO-binding membrane sensor protein with MHYT domain